MIIVFPTQYQSRVVKLKQQGPTDVISILVVDVITTRELILNIAIVLEMCGHHTGTDSVAQREVNHAFKILTTIIATGKL